MSTAHLPSGAVCVPLISSQPKLTSKVQQLLQALKSCLLSPCLSPLLTKQAHGLTRPCCYSVREFQELAECLEVNNHCPKTLARALLPEAAVEHAVRAVPSDQRGRRWKPHPQSQWELVYSCAQGQMNWNSPDGRARQTYWLVWLAHTIAAAHCKILLLFHNLVCCDSICQLVNGACKVCLSDVMWHDAAMT